MTLRMLSCGTSSKEPGSKSLRTWSSEGAETGAGFGGGAAAAVGAGAAFGGAKGRRDVPRIVDWYMNGKINIDELITHKLALEDINKSFELMLAGESIHSVVVF